MKRYLKKIWDLLYTTYVEWGEHDSAMLAAGLAYYLLVTLAPLALVLAYTLGVLLQQIDVVSFFGLDSLGFTPDSLPVERISELVGNYAANLSERSPLIAIGITVVGASVFIAQLAKAFDEVWESEPEDAGWKYVVKIRVFGLLGVLVMSIIAFAVSLLFAAYQGVMNAVRGAVNAPVQLPDPVQRAFDLGPWIGFAGLVLLFSLAFTWLPSADVRWRETLVGSAFTAVLYSIGQWALNLYLSRSAVVSTWGAAGSIIALIIWIFYTMQIVLLGAVFTRVWIEGGGLERFRDSAGRGTTSAGANGTRDDAKT